MSSEAQGTRTKASSERPERLRTVGICLAAGRSSRMGTDKLKLPLGSRCLGNYALEAALESRLDRLFVVIGSNTAFAGGESADWVERSYIQQPAKRKWSFIRCLEAHRGQAYSLRCGVRAAIAAEADAAMILLADQPFVTNRMMNELLSRYEEQLRHQHGVRYVASSYMGIARPPVIFDQSAFSDLLKLDGDQGARQLIRDDPSGITVEFTDPDWFMDVDTPEDYGALLVAAALRKS